jgi:hypothetical protein
MERTLHKTLIVALVAGPVVVIAVAAWGRAPASTFQPVATRTVRTVTIPAGDRPDVGPDLRALHPAPGLRLSRPDADGCGVAARAVRQPDGGMRTQYETFCRH